MAIGGNDSYTVSLIHMDGADQSTSFPEDPYINCKFPDIPILNFRKLNCGINDTDNEAIALGGAGTWDAGAIMHPCVFQNGSTIYLYYTGKNASGVYAIGLATASVSGFTGKFTSKSGSNPILTKGSGGQWNETGVDYPFVIYDADASLWKMWYVGWNGAGTYAIGYATSSDGISWNPYGSSAILSPDTAWEGSIVMSPCVLRLNSTTYKMLYTGNNPAPPGAQTGLATSSDGISWSKYGSNPVLIKGPASSWDEYSTHGVRTLKYDSGRALYEILYCGKPNDTNKYSSIGYANSADLITWNKSSLNPTLVVTKTWESHEMENASILLLNYLNYVYYDTWYGSPSTIGLAIFGSPAHSWTYHGNAKIVTAQSEFGGASGSFPGATGTGGDWIDTPDSEDFSVGKNPFTIDFWLKRGATGALLRVLGQCDSTGSIASTAFYFYFGADNKLNVGVGVGAALKTATSTGTIAETTTWHHIAIVRNGDTLYLYIDGTNDGSVALGAGAVINNSTNKFSIGRQGEYTSNNFNGYIDEFRFSNGIARWTANFTPPVSAYDDGSVTVNVNLESGVKTIFGVSENTDQILDQNLVSGSKTLFSPSENTDQILDQDLPLALGGVLASSQNTDQILDQNLISKGMVLFSPSFVLDHILTQNLLESITSILSILVSIDQDVSVNVISSAGSPYEVTVEIIAGGVSITVDLGLLLAIASALESSLQTDQILSQSIIEKLGEVLGSSENTDQILTPNVLSALAEALASSQNTDQNLQLNALSALASIYQILVKIIAAPENFGYLKLKLESPPALPEGDFAYEHSSLKTPDQGPEGSFAYQRLHLKKVIEEQS